MKMREKLKVLNAESSNPSADLKCTKLTLSFLVLGEGQALVCPKLVREFWASLLRTQLVVLIILFLCTES
jgi:hypothetical protein